MLLHLVGYLHLCTKMMQGHTDIKLVNAFIHAFTSALLISSSNGSVTQICVSHVDLIECTTDVWYSSVSLCVNHLKRCGFCTRRMPLC